MAPLAVVTGATGFMARHLIPAAGDAGWDVRACGRRPRPHWLPGNIAYHRADLAADDAPLALPGLVEGADAVFHLAGATSSLSSREEMHRSNPVATANLVAAARAAGVGRFVHMGSTSIYGEEVPLPQPVLETAEPHPSRGYGKEKWLAEQAVWAASAEGLPVAVLRPVSVFGPGAFKLLASAALDAAIERHAGSRSLLVEATSIELRLVHIDDVVGACLHLARAEGATGRAYNVVASSYPSALQVAGWLAGSFGMPVECSANPDPGLPLAERRETWQAMVHAGMEPAILFTDERLRFLKKANANNRLSVGALLATGFRFRYGGQEELSAGVAETIDWYRSRRWIL